MIDRLNRRIVIFEGPDRVGKSTQINLLLKHLWQNFCLTPQVIHFGHIGGLSDIETKTYSYHLYNEMFSSWRFNKFPYIYDRSHIGEAVYGPLYRGYSADYIYELENEYRQNLSNVFLITLVNSPSELLLREDGLSLKKDGEDPNKLKKIEIDRFKKATSLSLIPNKKIIDCKGKTPEQVHEEIIKFIQS